MKVGDLIYWTFAKTSPTHRGAPKLAILCEEQKSPVGSWIILVGGQLFHACPTELECISEIK